LAAAIKARLGLEVELVAGARGAFEVRRDADLLFSKLERGRFPKDDDEIVGLLR
jgi:hypothetical protein